MPIHRHNIAAHLGSQSTTPSLDALVVCSTTTTRTQSTTSIISNGTTATTPEFSPHLIESEVGRLLHLDDAELDEEYIIDDDCDYENDDVTTEYSSNQADDSSDPAREKWFICLVGLPASGKSTVVNQLAEFVHRTENHDIRMKTFNAGDIRRKHEKEMTKKLDFDFTRTDTKKLREKYAFEALEQLTTSLINNKIDIGVLDATNTTRDRREHVIKTVKKVSQESGVPIHSLILEVKCSNQSLRRFNIEKKTTNRDYAAIPRESAILDFFKRVENYEKVYERVSLEEINKLGVKYFSINNVGDSFCYDCGLQHKDSKKHRDCVKFKSLALRLIYEFLMNYRKSFGALYLLEVESFYKNGLYRPVSSRHSSMSLLSLGSSETSSSKSPVTPVSQGSATVATTSTFVISSPNRVRP